jgi:hypothetical protein
VAPAALTNATGYDYNCVLDDAVITITGVYNIPE